MTDPQGLLLRDCRRRGHFTIDNEAVDDGWLSIIGVNAYAVYSVICRHADINTSSGFPGIPLMMERTGLSKAEVIRCLKRLEETRLISIPIKGRGRGHKSETYLLDKSLWVTPETYKQRQPRKDKGTKREKGILEIPNKKGISKIPFKESDKNEQEKVSTKYVLEQEKVSNKSIKGIYEIDPLSLYKETNKETIILIETEDRAAKISPHPQNGDMASVDYASLTHDLRERRDIAKFPKNKNRNGVPLSSEQEQIRRQELLRQAQQLKGA